MDQAGQDFPGRGRSEGSALASQGGEDDKVGFDGLDPSRPQLFRPETGLLPARQEGATRFPEQGMAAGAERDPIPEAEHPDSLPAIGQKGDIVGSHPPPARRQEGRGGGLAGLRVTDEHPASSVRINRGPGVDMKPAGPFPKEDQHDEEKTPEEGIEVPDGLAGYQDPRLRPPFFDSSHGPVRPPDVDPAQRITRADLDASLGIGGSWVLDLRDRFDDLQAQTKTGREGHAGFEEPGGHRLRESRILRFDAGKRRHGPEVRKSCSTMPGRKKSEVRGALGWVRRVSRTPPSTRRTTAMNERSRYEDPRSEGARAETCPYDTKGRR